MKPKRYLILAFAAVTAVILSFTLSAAQEGLRDTQLSPEPEVQWLWGEVVSLGQTSGSVVVKYLDYETDTEKQILIGTNDKTTYENITCLTDLKPMDAVSVDYLASPDGENIAKNISLEKAEAGFNETESSARVLLPD